MKPLVTIGSAVLSSGIPKICVPIVGRSIEEITTQCRKLSTDEYDIIELRIDFLPQAPDPSCIKAALTAFRNELPTAPLLFTFRTKEEGGVLSISETDYFHILRCAIHTGCIDAIDVEYARTRKDVLEIISLAHDRNITVVASNHDFSKTPSFHDITHRLTNMIDLGADVAKLACMPNSPKDVLTLLSATEAVKSEYPDTPLITMSMGKLGMISRISGEIFGSAMTFGAVGTPSAPGQLESHTLRHILEILH